MSEEAMIALQTLLNCGVEAAGAHCHKGKEEEPPPEKCDPGHSTLRC